MQLRKRGENDGRIETAGRREPERDRRGGRAAVPRAWRRCGRADGTDEGGRLHARRLLQPLQIEGRAGGRGHGEGDAGPRGFACLPAAAAGCALPVGRASRRRRCGVPADAPRLGADARASYAGGLAAYLDRLAERMAAAHPSAHPPGRRDAIAAFSQMVGALLLSRAIADVGPALADEILEAGRQALADSSDGTARSA